MTRIITTLALLGCCAAASAQTPYWQDLNVYRTGGESQRTEVVFTSDRAAALSGGFEAGENYISLNGTWKFGYWDSHNDLPENVVEASKDGWDEIKVPGNWERQGFGTAIYVNTHYEFCPLDPEPPTLPADIPVGVYERKFTVPASWDGRAVYLNICGAKSGVYVYINGSEVGYSEDSKDLHRYNITNQLREGENDLVLKIYRYTTGSYLECQDFWRISGIERDVYLSSEKADKGFDFAVISTLEESLQNGIFHLTLSLNEPVDFSYELLDSQGTAVLSGSKEAASDGDSFAGIVKNPALWSAETPNLYTLLMCVDGEYTRFNVGFRRFEIVGNVFLVNGQPVKFKGVNLHEHDMYSGHYVTRETMLEDLRLMRENNINAIRTCHYPQPRYFYDLCDSLGFYVYDEANVESHGMGYSLDRTLGNNPTWYPQHIDRILNMYYRTRNYPCVTIWSLGNEAGNGYNFYRAYEELKALEKDGMNRPVCYERAEMEWNTDMRVPQYPGAGWFRRMGEQGSDKPACPSEYAHAMGNSTGSLDLQWYYIYQYDNLQGGFIWDWVDQGFAETDENGTLYFTYGGDYGENAPSDANFLCNGIVNPDRTPHPAMAQIKHVYQNISITPVDAAAGKFSLFNRFYFTSLEGYELRYSIVEDGKKVSGGSLRMKTPAQTAEDFSIAAPKLASDKLYTVDFEVISLAGDALIAPGHVVATDQFVLQKPQLADYTPKAGKFTVDAGDEVISIACGNNSFEFDIAAGVVSSYKIAGKEYFHDGFGLQPNFWRAPTDNDYGNGWQARTWEWKAASHDFNCTASSEIYDDRAVLTVEYALPNGHPYSIVYTFYANGILNVKADLKGVPADGRRIELPRMGLRMRLPASANAFSYYGRGPEENYADRKSGIELGLYKSTAESEYYPYVRPQENGHHTDCRYLSIGGVTIVADGTLEFNVLKNSVEDFDSEDSDRPYQWFNFSEDEEHDEAKAAAQHMRRQTHINDIAPRDYVEVCLDAAQSGIGGYDSWGATAEDDMVLWSDQDYSFSFTMVPQKVLSTDKAVKYSY